MALTGNNNEQKIWNFLLDKLGNPCGVAGMMGNIYAESGLQPNNLQNAYEKKLGYTDASYTAAVDSGSYSNFIHDSAGYGLCQWTYWSRKKALKEYADGQKKSIGDLEMQLCFLMVELNSYKSVLNTLKTAKSVLEASNAVLLQFERPADQSESVQKKRAGYGQTYYDKYAATTSTKKEETTMGYSNSSLVDCTVKSPNHSGTRTHKIDRITPHCVVGQLSAESIGGCFPKGRDASCNYGIGKDGRVCLIVDEQNRSWCSSSGANDQRAITIECASGTAEPYEMNDAVYKKLVKLCIDICKRNGLSKVLWFSDKTTALNYSPKSGECVLTVHRWFANKSCPGNWLYSRMGQLASEINAGLGNSSTTEEKKQESGTGATTTSYKVRVAITDLNIRKGPGTNYAKTGSYTGAGVFTIVAESSGAGSKKGWGKLKSGAGWIALDYCQKV